MAPSKADPLDALIDDIRACRLCRDMPKGAPLPHEPRPVLRARASARLGIFGQAPGTRVHASGTPFLDPSGDRLRSWLGLDPAQFYDDTQVAIVPMSFCFPGLDAEGGDRPPRPECAPRWRQQVMDRLPNLELCLLIGQYAQRWHLAAEARGGVSVTVADWRRHLEADRRPKLVPLPHPSWRNTGWLKRNPWFETELVPELRRQIRQILSLS